MKSGKTLTELIESRISLGKEAATGFRAVRCMVCNDHSTRAGFKIQDSIITYKCFNCSKVFIYSEHDGNLSKNARFILRAFGITDDELTEVTAGIFFKNGGKEAKELTLEKLTAVSINTATPEIQLPPDSYPVGCDIKPEFQLPLAEYLLSRKIDPIEIRAHFSLNPAFLNRVILPCYRNGKVIFWQARALGDVKPRYKSPSLSKGAVLWGYDNLWGDMRKPLFITEGILDAASVDGVAILASTLTPSQEEVLSKNPRRKIVITDPDKNGEKLAKRALKLGWEFTYLPDGDANKTLQLHGPIYLAYQLMKNINSSKDGPSTNDGLGLKSLLELQLRNIKGS